MHRLTIYYVMYLLIEDFTANCMLKEQQRLPKRKAIYFGSALKLTENCYILNSKMVILNDDALNISYYLQEVTFRT